jgi:microcin C transport system substrate-binding protein
MLIDRRLALKLFGAAGAMGAAGGLRLVGVNTAFAREPDWRHGMSLFGELKYPADFEHFEYVNPAAPKGGRARLYAIGSFDSLNPYTFKGQAAGLVTLTNDSLMAAAFDEPSTEYGLVVEAVRHPEDFASVTFRLRAQARFHDGQPITAEDVIWSMTALKEAHPQFAFYYQNVETAEQTGEREVTFYFSVTGNRELPHIVGQLPVLPKHWWTGTTEDGRTRNLAESTLEPPLGSGPYRIGLVNRGREIRLTRVEDYWASDLPVNRGKHNFDELSLTYFRDQTVALEAFKGDQYDWRVENSAKDWATGYDFPAVARGDVVVEEITLENPEGMQAFAFNTRRSKFSDPRVRLAFNHAFDFEWANENLFYGQYVRSESFFANSELAATGTPGPEELAILDEIKDQVPPEVFTTEFSNPVNGSTQDRRNNLRTAARLLQEAGWTPGGDRILRNEQGEPFEVEFLLVSPAFERIVLPYAQQLERIGIRPLVRTVDSAQYERRTQTFEFDIVVTSWGQSLSPGNEQRDFWGSEAADRPGSRNLVGIRSEAVDYLIDRVIFAEDRDDLVTATRTLDRVLLWHHYVVPTWHIPYDRTARWDRFGRPDTMPDHSIGFPTIWWFDADKAAKIRSS